jgi:hypothetical protein
MCSTGWSDRVLRELSRCWKISLGKPLLLALSVAGISGDLSAQIMLLDRGLPLHSAEPHARQWAGLHAAWVEDAKSFVGDDFNVGVSGEVWTIDTLRTWVLVETAPGPLFEKITLYGGLAGQPIPKEQAECACHSLVPLKTTGASGSPDVIALPAKPDAPAFEEDGKTFGLMQIEFRNLRWSVPGGVGLQFAVRADTLRGWFNYASPTKVPHRLRVFDAAAQLRSFRGGDENGINLQVWGHLFAKVGIRRAGALIHVTLSGGPAFDVHQVDKASLRLDRGGSGPVSTTVQDADGDGMDDLVAAFPGPAVSHGSVSVCLTGKRLDGIPFEGCDLLADNKP